MMNKLNIFFAKYKTVIQNFSYLSALQFFNVLLPLVTYPYLIRVLGAQIYGTVIFANAIVVYFSIIINFGFNITATKDIAENKNDKKKLNEIVSSVLIIKGFLWILSFVILLGFLIILPSFKNDWLLYILTFGMTFNELLFPQWFFQGIEKMKYITVLNIISRLLFTLLIFVFIHKEDDYLLVPLFQSFGAIFGGAMAFYIVLVKEKIHLTIQKKSVIKYYFMESLPLFVSALSVQIYVNANRVLIGAFLGMQEVAFYDLGEKILRIIKIPVGMIGQAAFPLLAREKNIRKINMIMKFGVIVTITLIILVFVLSETIVTILGGDGMKLAVPIMRILSLSALMVAFSQFLGKSRLIIFGFKKIFTQIIASSSIFFGVGALVLYSINSITIISLAWLAVAVEVWVTVLMLIANYNKKLLK